MIDVAGGVVVGKIVWKLRDQPKVHLERLSELMLVLLVGGMLLPDFWNWRT